MLGCYDDRHNNGIQRTALRASAEAGRLAGIDRSGALLQLVRVHTSSEEPCSADRYSTW